MIYLIFVDRYSDDNNTSESVRLNIHIQCMQFEDFGRPFLLKYLPACANYNGMSAQFDQSAIATRIIYRTCLSCAMKIEDSDQSAQSW